MSTIQTIFENEKFIAVIRTSSAEDAEAMIQAASQGGIQIFEVSTAVPHVFKIVEGYASKHGKVFGIGGVTDGEVAQRAINSGAQFIASNYTDQEIINVAKHNDCYVIQGAATLTEASEAFRYGANLVKIYPANMSGGPEFVRMIRENLPFNYKLAAEGDIRSENAIEYLKHCSSVFVNNALYDRAVVRKDNWTELTERAKKLTAQLEPAKATR